MTGSERIRTDRSSTPWPVGPRGLRFWLRLWVLTIVTIGFYLVRVRIEPRALDVFDQQDLDAYVVGKTGSGKTTPLLHLIKGDLENGRGVCVIAPEAELFRDWLLPLVPERRAEDVVYFAPGHPKNPVTFNPLAVEPGDDQGRAAEDLFAIFKRAVGEEEFGARMSPILANAFACLTGRPGATLWDVKRLLEDSGYQKEIAANDHFVEHRQLGWARAQPGC